MWFTEDDAEYEVSSWRTVENAGANLGWDEPQLGIGGIFENENIYHRSIPLDPLFARPTEVRFEDGSIPAQPKGDVALPSNPEPPQAVEVRYLEDLPIGSATEATKRPVPQEKTTPAKKPRGRPPGKKTDVQKASALKKPAAPKFQPSRKRLQKQQTAKFT